MAMEVFFRALTLVSSLALALVYGLGGWLALEGSLDAGTIVTLALLLSRLYGPLTALSTARIDVTAALVSFERVFEVLDVEPLVKEPAHPTPLPTGPLSIELRDVRFAYPAADKVSLASLEEVAVLDDTVGEEVAATASTSRSSRASWSRWWARRVPASRPSPVSSPVCTTSTPVRSDSAASTCVTSPSTTSAPPSAS